MKSIYLIKDLSILSGHSIHTINYYINLGLLKAFARSPETRIRFFDERTLKRLKEIRQMRAEGLSIASIRGRLRP